MKTIYNYLFTAIISLISSFQSFSQTAGTSVCMEISNVILTAPDEFTFDVNLKNSGSSVLKLRGYGCGLNLSTGLANGGALSATYVSRDTSLTNLPAVTVTLTSFMNHLRFTTVNAVSGSEVLLTPMLPYRLATVKMKTTTTFNPLLGMSYDPFNPAAPSTPLQVLVESGKSICEATCLVNPTPISASSYRLIGTGITTTATNTLPVLHGAYNSWGTCISGPTSLPSLPTIGNFSISHNESFSDLKLRSNKNFSKLNVRFINMTGETVLQQKNINGAFYSFDFSRQPSGIYFIELQNAEGRELIKFVKN